MTMPHTCRCATCGAEGVIIPNAFDELPRAYGGTGREFKPLPVVDYRELDDEALEGPQHHVSRLVPTGTNGPRPCGCTGGKFCGICY